MPNKICRTVFSALLALILIAVTATALPAQEEPKAFSAEEPIAHSAKIPAPIMSQLRRDPRVKQCVSRKNTIKSSWFSAAKIDLNGDQIDDYVVKARNSCLFGANLAPFWVFHNLTTRYSLVLRADALGLEILPEKTEDYRNIKISRATATDLSETVLKFDGAHYQ